MTSQNNHITSQRGSALIVTMLLVSVLLATALILLQRIVPYAKSVRSMHDASQAYYVARGQVDLARYNFLYGGGGEFASLQFPSLFGILTQLNDPTNSLKEFAKSRGNISASSNTGGNTSYKQLDFRILDGNTTKTPVLGIPFKSASGKDSDHVVVSANNQAPLQMKLFATDKDVNIARFGTSKTDPGSHTLYSRNAGGLRFDLRGVDTDNNDFLLRVATGSTSGIITLKMQYYAGGNADVKTFTGEYDIASTGGNFTPSSGGVIGTIQSIQSNGGIVPSSGTFKEFLGTSDCSNATICSLTLILNSGGPSSLDFQLIAGDKQIPDLNAVVVGDGLSGNKLYYQRIIDLIPTPQDI